MLEVMSLEVLGESVRTVAGAQSWRQRVPEFRRCDCDSLYSGKFCHDLSVYVYICVWKIILSDMEAKWLSWFIALSINVVKTDFSPV